MVSIWADFVFVLTIWEYSEIFNCIYNMWVLCKWHFHIQMFDM